MAEGASQEQQARLAGRRVAITGAGSGLGRELALAFAADGWRVAVTDVDGERAHAVAAEVEAAGGEALVDTLDTRKDVHFTTFCERLRREWDGLDVFVNNAGVSAAGSAVETPLADWEWMLDINLMGMVRGSRAALPLLRETHGQLVNIASFAAIANAPGMSAYNVAKAGVLSLSESIRGEEYDAGVGVTVACPAFFSTNLLDSFRATNDRQRAMVEKLMAKAPVSAADVAAQIKDAAEQGRFLVLTHSDTRWQYRLKRLSPESFFKAVLKATRSFNRS